ncbi:MAG: universal stress protein [Myxococcota bacterium]
MSAFQFPPKRIVVATDLSEASRPALEMAAAYGRRFEAEVILASAFDPTPFVAPVAIPGPADTLETAAKEMRRGIEDALRELKAGALAELGDDVRIECIRHHAPGEGIVELAEKNDADLIIVGSHGRTGLARVLLGSVAERVVRLSRAPVLVVDSGLRG